MFARSVRIAFGIFLVAGIVPAATISGTVTTSDGKAVRASLTIHDLSTVRVKGSAAFDRQFGSRADGSFALAGVPAGTYEICVDAPHEGLLDPCVWSEAGKFSVSTADVAKLAVVAQRGQFTQLRVNDAGSILEDSKTKNTGGHLAITVQSGGGKFHHFRLLSSDLGGQSHYAVLPIGVPLTVTVSSADFAVKDEKNNRAAGDTLRIPVVVKSGESKTISVGIERK